MSTAPERAVSARAAVDLVQRAMGRATTSTLHADFQTWALAVAHSDSQTDTERGQVLRALAAAYEQREQELRNQ